MFVDLQVGILVLFVEAQHLANRKPNIARMVAAAEVERDKQRTREIDRAKDYRIVRKANRARVARAFAPVIAPLTNYTLGCVDCRREFANWGGLSSHRCRREQMTTSA